jgi:biopolymer transport protein ExbD
LRNVIDDLLDRISRIRLRFGRSAMARVRKLSEVRPHRLEALIWGLRTRLRRSADGIIVVPLLGVVLVLGVFTATAVTHQSSDGANSNFAPAHIGSDVSTDVVTVTVRRPGKPKVVTVKHVARRVVRRPGGVSTMFESVAGPTRTVTITGPSKTVTQVVTETVTTVVTVTTKKP